MPDQLFISYSALDGRDFALKLADNLPQDRLQSVFGSISATFAPVSLGTSKSSRRSGHAQA